MLQTITDLADNSKKAGRVKSVARLLVSRGPGRIGLGRVGTSWFDPDLALPRGVWVGL